MRFLAAPFFNPHMESDIQDAGELMFFGYSSNVSIVSHLYPFLQRSGMDSYEDFVQNLSTSNGGNQSYLTFYNDQGHVDHRFGLNLSIAFVGSRTFTLLSAGIRSHGHRSDSPHAETSAYLTRISVQVFWVRISAHP